MYCVLPYGVIIIANDSKSLFGLVFFRRIPYVIALKCKHGECAALLNPSSAEPLVWPKPLKFISDLSPDTKVLLETALLEANLLREKKILKGTMFSLPSPPHSEVKVDDDTGSEVLCICLQF